MSVVLSVEACSHVLVRMPCHVSILGRRHSARRCGVDHLHLDSPTISRTQYFHLSLLPLQHPQHALLPRAPAYTPYAPSVPLSPLSRTYIRPRPVLRRQILPAVCATRYETAAPRFRRAAEQNWEMGRGDVIPPRGQGRAASR